MNNSTPLSKDLPQVASLKNLGSSEEGIGSGLSTTAISPAPAGQADSQEELQRRSRKDGIPGKNCALGPDSSEETIEGNQFRSGSKPNQFSNASGTPTQPQPLARNTDSKPSKGAAASYGWFIFALVCVTVCLGSVIFQLALATAKGSADAFPQGGPFLVGVIFTAIWAKQSWSHILLAEPEIDPMVRRKHRIFGLKAGAIVALTFLVAGGFGAYLGLRSSRRDSVLAQITALGARTAPIKQRYIQLARKDTPTIPEYLQRCEDLESVINEYEPALRQMDGLMLQMQTYLRSDPTSSEALSTMRRILQKDLESASTFRMEIADAKLLAALPVAEQIQFYDENIKPLQDAESRIANDEVEIMKSAKARGVKLPEQMYKEVGID